MLQDAVIVRGVVNRIEFTGPNGFLRLMDADARHLLLHLRFSAPEGMLFLNTQSDGAWGRPEQMPLPEQGTDRNWVAFKLEDKLELWNSAGAFEFERFSAEAAGQVRYCVMKNAVNPGDTLKLSVPRPEEMAAQITAQVAMRRLDALERQLGHVAPADPAAGT